MCWSISPHNASMCCSSNTQNILNIFKKLFWALFCFSFYNFLHSENNFIPRRLLHHGKYSQNDNYPHDVKLYAYMYLPPQCTSCYSAHVQTNSWMQMFLKVTVQMTDSVKRILNRYLDFPFLVKNYYVNILSICIGIKAGTLMHPDTVLENIQSSSFYISKIKSCAHKPP